MPRAGHDDTSGIRVRLYVWLAATFTTALLVGDLTGAKFFRIGGIDLSVGMISFPLTFVLTDVLNEFFGPRAARRVTFVGLGMAVFALGVIRVAMALPASPETPLPGDVFDRVFGWSTRLYIASLSAYVVGQLLDISLFHALRRVTGHRMLWLRATGSTAVSQLVDTVVVNAVLLSGTKPADFIVGVVGASYAVKLVVAVGLTPVIYGAHALVNRALRRAGEPTG